MRALRGICLATLPVFAAACGESSPQPKEPKSGFPTEPVALALDWPKGELGGIRTVGSWRTTFQSTGSGRQGDPAWYASRLKAQVKVTRGARKALVYLSGSTNDQTSTQIKIEVPPQDSSRRIRWTFFGLLDGLEKGHSASDTFSVDVRNYLQYRGVRPGLNHFKLQAQASDAGALKELRVLPGTDIIGGLQAPAKLTVRAASIRSTTEDHAVVNVVLRNAGGRPERNVVLRAGTAPANLLERPTVRDLGRLDPGQSKRVKLRLNREPRGPFTVGVGVRGVTARASATLRVSSANKPPRPPR